MCQIIVAAVIAIYFSSSEEWATAGHGFIEETDVDHPTVSN